MHKDPRKDRKDYEMKTIEQMVKETVEGAMGSHPRENRLEIPFGQVITWKSSDEKVTIEFHGTSILNAGFAIYQGQFGKWLIKLAPRIGGIANPQEKPCVKTSGKAVEIL